jgi:hypothetical protein
MAQRPIYGDKKPGPNCTGNYIVNRPDLKQNSSELSVFYLVLPELQKAKSRTYARAKDRLPPHLAWRETESRQINPINGL